MELAATGDQTAFAVQKLLAARYAIAPRTVQPGNPASPAYGCAAANAALRPGR
ncbi:hypothetical protein [Streptomyces sp. NRRL S-146]|uniref:hypothetical protein n=1 Tax=Streptomyces sp. NRRL S-146 TaxID=1463884 RepID=UPI000A683764|nr:hypothetical protein [Streptomyces sp. NRRL S-146]